MFFIIISALHVSGSFSAHHQELIKLYVQPWVLSCFPAVYRWCGCGSTWSDIVHVLPGEVRLSFYMPSRHRGKVEVGL